MENGTVQLSSSLFNGTSETYSNGGGLFQSKNTKGHIKLVVACQWLLAILVLIVVLGVSWLVMTNSLLKSALLWLDTQPKTISCIVFMLLYCVVSFPFIWGYIFLNLTCGYHFGLIAGVAVASSSAIVGITVSFVVMKRFFSGIFISRLLSKANLHNFLAVLERKQAFKIVAIFRLTPIPFGIQNALFSASKLDLGKYLTASAIGLFPAQLISTYLGTNLHSIKEIFNNNSTTAVTGYLILALQVIISAGLLYYLVNKAKKELDKTIEQELMNLKVVIT